MTAPNIKLVEKVAKATYSAFKSASDMMLYPWDSALSETKSLHMGYAKTAIAACHAEEMRALLRELIALNDSGDVHELSGGCECCGSWSVSTPQFTNAIEQVRALLAKLDGQP